MKFFEGFLWSKGMQNKTGEETKYPPMAIQTANLTHVASDSRNMRKIFTNTLMAGSSGVKGT